MLDSVWKEREDSDLINPPSLSQAVNNSSTTFNSCSIAKQRAPNDRWASNLLHQQHFTLAWTLRPLKSASRDASRWVTLFTEGLNSQAVLIFPVTDKGAEKLKAVFTDGLSMQEIRVDWNNYYELARLQLSHSIVAKYPVYTASQSTMMRMQACIMVHIVSHLRAQ